MTNRWIVVSENRPVRDGLSRLILTFPDKDVADEFGDMYFNDTGYHTERLEAVAPSVIRALRKRIGENNG